MSVRLLTYVLAGLAVVLVASEVSVYGQYGGGFGTMDTWDSQDMERVKRRHREKLEQQLRSYRKAFESVQVEERKAEKMLEKGLEQAEEKARGDAVRKKRGISLARHRAISEFTKVDFKYNRVYAAAKKLGQDEGFPEKVRDDMKTFLQEVQSQARDNRERLAGLYEEVDKPRKALAILEGIYRSLPEAERPAAGSLKQRITALKEELGIKEK